MIRKLLWKLIKVPLSPLFTALWVLRKIKGAISAAIWGSKKAASTATSASKTAASTASTAAERRRETDGAEAASESDDGRGPEGERRSAPEPARETGTGSKRDRRSSSGHGGETKRQYGRFESLLAGYAVFVFFLPLLTVLVLSVPFRYVSIAELIGNGLRIAIVPAIVASVARIRSKTAWYLAFGATALIFGLQALSLAGIEAVGVEWMGLGMADIGLVLDEPGLFALTLVEFAILGASLRAGWAGRQVAIGGGASAAGTQTPDVDSTVGESDPTDATARESSRKGQGERSAGQPDRTAAGDASADTEPRSLADRDAESAEGTDRSMDPAGPTTASPGSSTKNGAPTDVSTGSGEGDDHDSPSDPDHDHDRTDAADHESDPDSGHDSTSDHDPDLEGALERVRGKDVTPEAVRELQGVLPDDELPVTAATNLEGLADRDDPAVRLAVCEVCEAIDDERADDILKGLRIDRNDRVSNAAIEALR